MYVFANGALGDTAGVTLGPHGTDRAGQHSEGGH
jgi:hypothetical protein